MISHFILSKTHLITGSSVIIYSENLAEKTAVFGKKTVDFLVFPPYKLQLN